GSTVNIEPNTTLYFGPHARLIIEPGGALNATNATFKNACSSMWTGIELHSNDVLEASINLSNCSIENAHIGILDAEPAAFDLIVDGEYDPLAYLDGFISESWGADIVLDLCSFDACGIGFMHPNFEVLLPEIQDFQITNCTFSCPEYGLLDAQYLFGAENAYPNNQYPWYGLANSQKRSYCGVLIAGARGPSLGNLGNGNTFENLETGVRCFRSSVDVFNNQFNNIQFGVHYSNFGRYWNHTPGIKIQGNSFLNVNDPSLGVKNPNVLNALDLSDNDFIELAGDQSAGIRIEGVGFAFISNNQIIGNQDQMNVGGYAMNCNDLIVESHRFETLGFGIVVIDGESRQPGNNFIGPYTNPDQRNIFEECHTAFVAIGDNRETLFRCNNLIHDFNYSGNSWIVGGVLKDQGYTDEPNVSWTGAGNLFFSNEAKDISSQLIEFEGLNLDYQSTTWRYFYQDSEVNQLVPEEGIPAGNGGTVSLVDMGLTFDPDESCVRPYKHFEIQGLPSVKNLWLETRVDIEELELAQDEFQQKTSELLTAIYGGIQNELELKQFLIDHIPLSNEVIKQYMLKEDTPAEYFKDVIELNGELEKELLDIAKSKTAYLPENLKEEIMGLATFNSMVESTQELKSRAEVMETVMYDLVKAEIQDSLATNSMALSKLPEELRNTYLDAWIEVSSLSTTVSELRTKYPTSLNDDQLEWMMELVVESDNDLNQSTMEKRDSLYLMTQNYLLDENSTWALSVLDYRWSTPLYTLELDQSKRSKSSKHKALKTLSDFDLLSIHPNPADDWVYIKSDMTIESLIIYDMGGKIVREMNNISDFNHTLFIGDLKNGLYYISINGDQNLSKKFIVK
ncbi:MAG: T9SS type A sorting domain-containing protein, partial [Flavobacteriales bacterium]|nr:T9SS type A sorting domain-containing protein [Flavobacteriales bacterium]